MIYQYYLYILLSNKLFQMGNYCCSQKKQLTAHPIVVPINRRSLKDPHTKKQYQKTLEQILNQALQKFQEKYQIKSLKIKGLLGKGGQATVFQVDLLCQQNDDIIVKNFAMKRVSKSKIDKEKTRKTLLLQKQILSSRPSPFITEIEFACQDDAYLYFFMELAQGGDAFSLITNQQVYSLNQSASICKSQAKSQQFKALGQKGVVFVLASVILGLESLHHLNIIYRDLKPENILLFEDGYPRLADFGISLKQQDDDQLLYQLKGTTLYFAPEMLNNQGYDKSVDLWALGVLAYQFTFRVPPFSASIIKSHIFQDKIDQRINRKIWPDNNGSHLMRDFINKLLIMDSKKRLGYNSFDELKEHAIFSQIDWQQLQSHNHASPIKNIIKKYPVQLKKQKQIDEIIDQSQFGYIPFTFVRCDQDKKHKRQTRKTNFTFGQDLLRKESLEDFNDSSYEDKDFDLTIIEK